MKALLAKGADINAIDEDGNTALINECRPPYVGGGNLEVVRWLIRSGANIHLRNKSGQTALHEATLSSWDDIIRVLLSRGARIEESDLAGKTPLILAGRGGMTELGIEIPFPSTIKLLLLKGANVNAADRNGSTALIEAAKCQGGPQEGLEETTEAVRILLAAGANPNMRTKNGNTALKWAMLRHNREVIKLLKHAGAK